MKPFYNSAPKVPASTSSPSLWLKLQIQRMMSNSSDQQSFQWWWQMADSDNPWSQSGTKSTFAKLMEEGTSAYAGIPKYQFWSYTSLASFNLKLLEKVHKNEENEGESIEHITRSILHQAQDRKLSEMAKVWKLREPCLVSGLLPPSPRNYLRTGSICQSPPSQPLPDDPRRIKYKLPDCSHWLQHSDIQTSLVFHEYFAN